MEASTESMPFGISRDRMLGTTHLRLINSVILALVAMGFNLTFGISGVANFAYGAFYILAGYTGPGCS